MWSCSTRAARYPLTAGCWSPEQLKVDESALTGESIPAKKQVDPVGAFDAPLGDLRCLVFMNTLVTRGRGELVVVATGSGTRMGRLAKQIKATPVTQTPLQRQLGSWANAWR